MLKIGKETFPEDFGQINICEDPLPSLLHCDAMRSWMLLCHADVEKGPSLPGQEKEKKTTMQIQAGKKLTIISKVWLVSYAHSIQFFCLYTLSALF